TGSAAASVTSGAQSTTAAVPATTTGASSTATASAVAATTSSAATATTAAPVAATSRAAGGAAAPLRVVYRNSPEAKGNQTGWADAFMKLHPDVAVDAEELADSPNLTRTEKLSVQLAANTPPDIPMYDVFPLEFALQGQAVALDSYAAKDSDFSSWQYLDPKRQLGEFTYFGKLYGLGAGFTPYVLFYNRSVLKQAGLPFPPKSMSGPEWDNWNWDTYLTQLKQLTKRDGTRVTQIGQLYGGFAIGSNTYPLIWSNGGDVMVPDAGGYFPAKSTLATPPTLAALQYYLDLTLKYHVAPTDAETKASALDFTHGNAAFVHTGYYSVNRFIKANPNLDFDVAPMPHPVDNPKTLHNVLLNPRGWITQGSKHKDMAWEYLKFCAGPQGEVIALQTGATTIPSFKNSPTRDAFLKQRPPDNVSLFADVALGSPITWDARFPFGWDAYNKIISVGTGDVIAGKRAVEDWARGDDPQVDTLIAQSMAKLPKS
ncbi:MAG TPA: sugar ABC transporter substrate-binding protein, partial [Chloroflexota bacterium]|nr:sugar ABC transporter substrate-binding protein [Chloroflexota bacterium]